MDHLKNVTVVGQVKCYMISSTSWLLAKTSKIWKFKKIPHVWQLKHQKFYYLTDPDPLISLLCKVHNPQKSWRSGYYSKAP